jgi:hypothetical protein
MIYRTLTSLYISLIFIVFPSAFAAETGPPPGISNGNTKNAEDQFLLGRAYARGVGVKPSYEMAGYWYRKAAEQGNLKAMHNLGILFLEGQGTPKNEKEGARWIRRAAEKGDPGSQYLLGVLYLKGRGVPQETVSGVDWLKKAADAGNADALARLGQDYYFGDDGFPKDLQRAVPLIRAAAEKGNLWSCDTLGLLYRKGEGVPKDEKLSNEWLSKGAHAGPIHP